MAKANGRPSVMVTFEPHPRDVFAPKPFLFRLTDGEQKARLAAALGFDGIVVLPFTPTLAAVEAEDFVTRFLIEALKVSEVVVGADFHFGRGRAGTPQFLKDAGSRHGFGVHVFDLLASGVGAISSSRIREALKAGETAAANQLLGYHWLVEGTVIAGDKRGRELGFPTANFALPANSDLAQGVYAVRVKLGNRIMDGVAAYGKPMFDNVQPPFEAHIFDFDEDIYGSHIAITLIDFLRGQQKFDGLDQLITQMNIDSQKARDILAMVKPLSDLDRQLGVII
jgi:riboflavin kinase / FMN adenylyltransferase